MDSSRLSTGLGVCSVLIAALCLSSCGGWGWNNSSPPRNDDYYGTTDYRYDYRNDVYRRDGYQYDQYGYYDEYGYYDSYGNLLYNPNEPAYRNLVENRSGSRDPFMQNYANINDRSVSQYVNSTYSMLVADMGGSLQDLLVQADGGEFYVNPADYTLASRNAVLSEGGNLESSLLLTSSYNGVSLASYTFEEFFGSEQITEFSIEGSGSFGAYDNSGLYIGIRQYGDRDTRWYGPYRNGMDWTVQPLQWKHRFESRHAFVTLAVFGGDTVTINRLHAEVSR
jgi:hypothetical protein